MIFSSFVFMDQVVVLSGRFLCFDERMFLFFFLITSRIFFFHIIIILRVIFSFPLFLSFLSIIPVCVFEVNEIDVYKVMSREHIFFAF